MAATLEVDSNQPVDARISRVVPGRLVYVETTERNQTIALTPDRLRIEETDGSLRRYRGESFKELGLAVGTDVKVVFAKGAEGKVIVAHPKARRGGFFARLRAPSLK